MRKWERSVCSLKADPSPTLERRLCVLSLVNNLRKNCIFKINLVCIMYVNLTVGNIFYLVIRRQRCHPIHAVGNEKNLADELLRVSNHNPHVHPGLYREGRDGPYLFPNLPLDVPGGDPGHYAGEGVQPGGHCHGREK